MSGLREFLEEEADKAMLADVHCEDREPECPDIGEDEKQKLIMNYGYMEGLPDPAQPGAPWRSTTASSSSAGRPGKLVINRTLKKQDSNTTRTGAARNWIDDFGQMLEEKQSPMHAEELMPEAQAPLAGRSVGSNRGQTGQSDREHHGADAEDVRDAEQRFGHLGVLEVALELQAEEIRTSLSQLRTRINMESKMRGKESVENREWIEETLHTLGL